MAVKPLAVGVLAGVALLPVVAGLAGLAGTPATAFAAVLAAPGARAALTQSLVTGTLATALALVLAHVLVAAAVTGGWLGRLRAATLPLLAVPHLALGTGLVLLLAPSGVLLRLLSPWATGFYRPPDWATVQDPYGLALVLGLVIKETAFLLLAMAAALPQVPVATLTRSTRALGYGRWQGWCVAVAPLIARQLRLPLAAVYGYALTNVELALPLGPTTPPTFALLVWQWFSSGDLADRELARAGSLLLLGMTLLAFAAGAAGLALGGRLLRAWAARGVRRPLAGVPLVVVAGGALGLVGIAAVLALPLRAVTGPVAFPALLAPPGWPAVPGSGPAVAATLALAAAVAVLVVAGVLPAAEALAARPRARARLGVLLFVPLLLPQLAFLFGLQVLLVRLGLDGTAGAVLWSQLVFALPYAWGLLAPARAAIDPRLPLVARTLGAGPWSAWWRVMLPLLARSTLVAAALAAAVSAGLYLPTLFAGGGRIATLATEAAAALAAGNLREATVHALLQAAVPLAAFGAAFAGGRVLFRHRRGLPA